MAPHNQWIPMVLFGMVNMALANNHITDHYRSLQQTWSLLKHVQTWSAHHAHCFSKIIRSGGTCDQATTVAAKHQDVHCQQFPSSPPSSHIITIERRLSCPPYRVALKPRSTRGVNRVNNRVASYIIDIPTLLAIISIIFYHVPGNWKRLQHPKNISDISLVW